MSAPSMGRPGSIGGAAHGSLPCEIEIKADYGANKVAMELTNVRRLGRVAYQLAPRAFGEAVGHLGHYLLGGDDDFEAVARAG